MIISSRHRSVFHDKDMNRWEKGII